MPAILKPGEREPLAKLGRAPAAERPLPPKPEEPPAVDHTAMAIDALGPQFRELSEEQTKAVVAAIKSAGSSTQVLAEALKMMCQKPAAKWRFRVEGRDSMGRITEMTATEERAK